ncbi:MAG: hypothetical protein JJE04_26080 [Acidobacteriia bacterium]|nr:hypothetical protein [Terriglobia bacterium]
MQHFRIKLFALPGLGPSLGAAIPVFHRFIQTGVLDEPLIDVADYRHVPDGPGVILVGHHAIYSLDSAKGRLGITYTRRTVLEGSVQDRLQQAFRSAVKAALLLAQAPEFERKLGFAAGECEISVNDRLLAPNTDATWIQLQPDLNAVLGAAWGAGIFLVRRTGQPRELFTVSATSATAPPLEQLLLRLQ